MCYVTSLYLLTSKKFVGIYMGEVSKLEISYSRLYSCHEGLEGSEGIAPFIFSLANE
jgi:hypothetical protein